MRYLVDTDWVIHCLNGDARFMARFEELVYEGVGVSMITLAEVYHGIYLSDDPEGEEGDFLRFLAGCDVLGLSDGICRLFGRERGRLKAAGYSDWGFRLVDRLYCGLSRSDGAYE